MTPKSKTHEATRSRALPMPVSVYEEQLKHLTRETFLRRNAAPLLLLAKSQALKAAILDAGPEAMDDDYTAVATLAATEEIPAYVATIVRRDNERSGEPIMLGRATRNDIVLPVPSVSAEHCQFVPPQPPDTFWSCRDLGSKNGTFVDGARLVPGQHSPLSDGAHLDIGRDVQGWFFTAADFWELIHDKLRMSALVRR